MARHPSAVGRGSGTRKDGSGSYTHSTASASALFKDTGEYDQYGMPRKAKPYEIGAAVERESGRSGNKIQPVTGADGLSATMGSYRTVRKGSAKTY
jgi:hypothetical protein